MAQTLLLFFLTSTFGLFAQTKALTTQAPFYQNFSSSSSQLTPQWKRGHHPSQTSTSLMTAGSYSNSAGRRDYLLYSPSKTASSAGLIVVLHGCLQTGEQMASGTGFNNLAEQYGLFVLYPKQTILANPGKCWNWFKPENLQRDQGELSILSGMTREIMAKNQIPPEKVVVTGLSAGAAMSSNLLACYSDLFAGAAIHSGAEFKAATSQGEALQALKSGSRRNVNQTGQEAYNCSPPRHQLLKVISIHGTEDSSVHLINSNRVIDQFLQVNDLIDDGRDNNSFAPTVQTRIVPPGPNGQYPLRVETYYHQGQPQLKKIWVEGMGHAWSGGPARIPYMDPYGIDVSQEILQFFF